MHRTLLISTLALLSLLIEIDVSGQKINHIKSGNLELISFGKRYNYLTPHITQTYHNAMKFHSTFWGYNEQKTYVLINDFEDIGNGGAITMPFRQVHLGISPYNFAFSIVPSNERFQWLFNHELTHIVMADKPNRRDEFFRKMMFGKVRRSEENPVSAIWSYFTTPRWYSPRWFHEGIACFMETWMSGGLGRAMGNYDEMYFRSIVNEDKPIYSLVGLETEGTTIDFQVGANSYLYGTRFITYLAYKYGIDNLKEFYNRTDSSKAFYAKQFRHVYNRGIKEVWKEWSLWEKEFQKENISQICKYPLTGFTPVTSHPLGSVSKMAFNISTGKIYAAINYPGIISQVAEIDMATGEIKKLATLDSPQLYFSTHLAYSSLKEKIYITENNSKYRSLVEIDVKSGSKKVINPFTRTGELVINPADQSLWGVMHDNGYSVIVKMPEPYNRVIPIYTAPFGRSVFDLDISHRGDKLSMSLSGVKGEQSVIMFDIGELEQGRVNYKTLVEQEDVTLTQFKFSLDDKHLIGTSYYTGVSNIWQIDLENLNFELLSNTKTGLFMPVQISKDSLLVLQFQRDGMTPGVVPLEVLEDANPIEFLGNKVHQEHPVVEEWSLPAASANKDLPLPGESSIYRPIKQMKFTNGYPDLGGFKETVAVGYRMNWRDPVGVSNIELFIALSPWSSYESGQKIHFMFDWHYWNWRFIANYNKTHFYDLFGPTKRSRAGYSLGVEYSRSKSSKAPLKSNYQLGLYTYGNLEVLPQYQNVESAIRSLQAASASYGISKLRKSLGGVGDERGYTWNISSTTFLANGSLFPSLVSNQDFGFLIPGIRNSSFWIRNSVGQSLGDRNSGMSNFYFGGFRNNYADWQPSEQYRDALAFPGANIDEIPAYNYLKTMGELNLPPLRLNNVGVSWLYPTFIKGSLFGTHLMTNFDHPSTGLPSTGDNPINRKHLFNAGGQLDIQMVLFSYLKTTWSIGYARKFEAGVAPTNQFMFSLKLLGE